MSHSHARVLFLYPAENGRSSAQGWRAILAFRPSGLRGKKKVVIFESMLLLNAHLPISLHALITVIIMLNFKRYKN
jgi:hypothetical protein